MSISASELRKTYDRKATAELVELSAKGVLTDTAMEVVDQVLRDRGVSVATRSRAESAARERIQRQEQAERLIPSAGERIVALVTDRAIAVAFMGVGLIAARAGLEYVDMVGGSLAIAYFLLADGLPHGQSLGKKWVRLAVVDARSGKPCSYLQSIVRTLVNDGLAGTVVIRTYVTTAG